MSRPSGRWKKKPETGLEKSTSSEVVDKKMEELVQDRREVSESESSSNSETEEEERKESIAIPAKKITEADLNEIGAKIVKSEIMGNEVGLAGKKGYFSEENSMPLLVWTGNTKKIVYCRKTLIFILLRVKVEADNATEFTSST